MKKILIGVTAVLAALTASFAIYVSTYYRADSSVDAYLTQAAEVSAEAESAQAAKSPDTRVKLEETAYGWFLDGPSEDNAQFGNYGAQKGDGEAVISAREQQEETIRFVMDVIKDREGNR